MYTREIKLMDDELPAKVNTITGEILEIKQRPNNIPEGKEVFAHDASFHKAYERSWTYLVDNLSPTELKVALMMSCMTEYSTNSLSPLDNNSSYEMIAERFDISKGSVKRILYNLMDIGIYASFKYSHYKRGIVDEWVFNPFISFKGKLLNSDLKNLFVNTRVAKHFLSSTFI